MNDLSATTEDTENTEERKLLNALSERMIGAAIAVHRELGPGLLESAYEICLCHELALGGVEFERQEPIPLHYKGVVLPCGYRSDLIVATAVLVEVKSVEALSPIHEAQLLSYLRLTALPLGLLINFNVLRLKDGVRRRLNTPSDSSVSSVSSVVPIRQ